MNAVIKLFLIIGLIAISISGCSGTERTASSQDETGAVSFQVEWVGAPNLPDDKISQSRALDCSAAGIATVTFEILDENDNYLTGQTWACSQSHGTVSGVLAGSNRTLIVEGKDSQERVRYRESVAGITVIAGQDNPVGTVECKPVVVIEYAYLQYRTYEDGTAEYRGWVQFSKGRDPIEMSDIDDINLEDPDGNPVFISEMSFWSSSYYTGGWNESTSTVDYAGLTTESGFIIKFPDGTQDLPAGWYTYEVTTDPGDILTVQVNFPGEKALDYVKVADMNYEWLSNGGLSLSWKNPVDIYDQLRIVFSNAADYDDLLYVKLPPAETALIIPAEQIQNIIDLKSPENALWVVQTRSYTDTSDASNYARGISNALGLPIYGLNELSINVPEDYTSIQDAIDAATNGDTILVADGTYTPPNADGFDFKGKAITVKSQNGPESCVINAGGTGRGFIFHNSESAISILSGFTITNGVIDGWSTGGGGILCDGASPTIENCIIRNNRTEAIAWGGGGISCVYSASPTIINCLIDSNSSLDADGGGGIYCDNASPIIRNCTIVNNSAGTKTGGGIYTFGPSSVTVTNTIFWGNIPDQIDSYSTAPSVTYSDIQDAFNGVGNININPEFAGTGIYSLGSESPCIDTGTASGAPDSDIAGVTRPQGSGYDMGAYEYQ